MLKLFGHVARIQRQGMHTEFWWKNNIRVATSKNKGSLKEVDDAEYVIKLEVDVDRMNIQFK
jgi:hypothetical protein